MGSRVPLIARPNHIAICGMPDSDLAKVREYYLVQLVNARITKDLDTQGACIDWVVSLTSEMRIRGGIKQIGQQIRQPDPKPLTQMTLREMFEAREARIVGLVSAARAHDSDAMEKSADAIRTIMLEMRLHGTEEKPGQTTESGIFLP
jgi:hypothetical protein